MKQILEKVTVTGADDSVISPHALVNIQEQYPFVEFGILLSERYSTGPGCNRFPSAEWLKQLASLADNVPLNLSGHFCGSWVKDALKGKWPDLYRIHPRLQSAFQRFQLNTHGEPHMLRLERFKGVLSVLSTYRQKVICQIDGLNNIPDALNEKNENMVHGLFDLSHGAGVLPSQWPKSLSGTFCGYAGGLSPENVAGEIEKIVKVFVARTWIDAETNLYSDGGRKFDLNRVRAFLEAAKPYVITP